MEKRKDRKNEKMGGKGEESAGWGRGGTIKRGCEENRNGEDK